MIVNANYPKCVTCIKLNCFAGEVNHAMSMNDRTRLECRLACGCMIFEKANSALVKACVEAIKQKKQA